MNYKEVLKKVGAALLALTFWEIAALLIHQRILLVTPVAVARRLCTIWRVLRVRYGSRSTILQAVFCLG